MSITVEQAELLRMWRPKVYELSRMIATVAGILDKPQCPHQKHENDLEASKRCEYCQVLSPLWAAVREMDKATDMLDRSLLHGPPVK